MKTGDVRRVTGDRLIRGWACALAVGGLLLTHTGAFAEAIPVTLEKTSQGWQLIRDGEPYFIRGAGGDGSLEALAAAGANSVRTWGGDPGPVLDKAQELGLTVTVGLWLGHERHDFDYNDRTQVERQLGEIRDIVSRYKDHPALLMWGVGNETEGFEEETNPRVWAAIDEAAALVKELDPNHPTMTVTVLVPGDRVDYVHNKLDNIDIHGVNSYGGAVVVADWLKKGKATKPFVLTEFGPVGPWEMPKSDWGAPYEQTSTDKAAFYRRVYEQAQAELPNLFLGSYAFMWGHKMEGTATWFGMFLDDGSPTAAVDVMSELWTGTPPDNLAPVNQPLTADGPTSLPPGAELTVRAIVEDPEGGALKARWALRRESGDYKTGGDQRQAPPDIEGSITEAFVNQVTVKMPEEPGAYRLFHYAYDEAGKAATANIPLQVLDPADVPERRVGPNADKLPIPVYVDGFKRMPWTPSGWMGNSRALKMTGSYKKNPFEGKASIRLRYAASGGWAAIAWQNPAENWGTKPGGFDLNGASALELWARGDKGGERISFGVGLLGEDKKYSDSAITKIEGVTLSKEWQKYRIPLAHLDLSSVITGFVVTIPGQEETVTVYLDNILYVP